MIVIGNTDVFYIQGFLSEDTELNDAILMSSTADEHTVDFV